MKFSHTVKTAVSALLLFVLSVSAYAAESTDTLFALQTQNTVEAFEESPVQKLKDASGELLGVANRGEWHTYPENSLEALIKSAQTGIDFVLADISLTSDKIAVLAQNDSAVRMFDGADLENISDITYENLKSYRLKNRSGGANNAATEYTVATLNEALDAFTTGDFAATGLMLRVCVDILDDTVALIDDYYATAQKTDKERPVLYITGKQADVTAVLPDLTDRFAVITEKRSNIVFNITSFIDTQAQNSAVGVTLKTTNRYGVIFNQTVLRHCKSIRAVIDTSDSETSGARQDTEKWWNDVISRGYSVIITDNAESFVKYKQSCNDARASLQSLVNDVTNNWQLPDFKSTALNDYYKAYNDAITSASSLLNDNSSSLQYMTDAFNALQTACDNIDANYEALTQGSAGLTVTPTRIFLCIGAAVAVLTVQIFFYKKRKSA